MTPYQLVPYAWPKAVKRKCFDMFIMGATAPEISAATGVPRGGIHQWSHKEKWREHLVDVDKIWSKRAEAIGTASIAGAIASLSASSKLLKRVHTCLDEDTPLKAAEIASIASALTDSTELLCRLLGK